MTDADVKLKQSLREKAVKDLEAWYEQRSIVIDKQRSKNRLGEADTADNRSVAASESGSYECNLPLNL